MRLIATLAVGAALVFAVTPAIAGKGGDGNGKGNREANGSCTVDGNVVTGVGLPTGEVVNFMVTDAGGTWGWVLGFTDTGTWSVRVPDRSGPTTYEFASRTWGPSGSKYSVFASCSA